jgi:small GTP-binding protein
MRSVRIVVVGDATVGKTALCFRYKDNTFIDEHKKTYFDLYNAIIRLKNGEEISVNLWDTAG